MNPRTARAVSPTRWLPSIRAGLPCSTARAPAGWVGPTSTDSVGLWKAGPISSSRWIAISPIPPATFLLGCRVKDATAGFKCWRRETLQGIDLSRIRSQGYVFQVEMAYVTERLGYRVLEIPIYFEDRRVGQSKMSMPVKIEAALRVLEVRWRHRHLRPGDRLTA